MVSRQVPTVAQLWRLVGNPAAYAVQRKDGRGYTPVRESVTSAVLRKHLDGVHTVGTYVVRGDQARTLVFDLDEPDEDKAQAIIAELERLGIARQHIGLEWSGNKGYHVWVPLTSWVSAATLRHIGLVVRAAVGIPKLEVNPKQAHVQDLGNLVKMPGGVHRATGERSYFIGTFPVPLPMATVEHVAAQVPKASVALSSTPPPPFRCMEAIQQGVGEGQRNMALFHLAVMLRRAGLEPDLVAEVVRRVNDRCDPPLDAIELENLLRSSQRSGPLCRTLEGTDLHCGEDCILARIDGLYVRPGRVRWAAVGEPVVVRVRINDGESVEFEHPDLSHGWGKFKKRRDGN